MKYVLQWNVRKASSDGDTKRVLDLFTKWEPAADVEVMLNRIDGEGGFNIVETDNPADLYRDISKFRPFLEFAVYPVIDVQQGAQIDAEAVEYQASI